MPAVRAATFFAQPDRLILFIHPDYLHCMFFHENKLKPGRLATLA